VDDGIGPEAPDDDVGYEEIGTGPVGHHGPARAGRWTRIAWAVIGAFVLGAAIVSLMNRPPASHHPAAAAPSDPLGPAASFVPPVDGTQPGPPYVTVGLVCQVRTDHRATLDVAFTLVALTDESVRVVSVEPVLPLGGLREVSTTVSAGTCSHPEATAMHQLNGSEYLIVTMHLALTGGCPGADPVMATVHELVDDRPATDQIPVLPDLGEVSFSTCETG
jgi:hypothetical protein